MNELCLRVQQINKIYYNLLRKETIALNNIDLDVRKGEFISIIGPSGCGKSTLLKIIGNLEKPSSGVISFSEKKEAEIGFVFQDAVLLPWKNVLENAMFPLMIKNKVTSETMAYLDQLLELAGLAEFKKSLPRELSGGMMQRVSIVRALSYNPPILLMDEPFGALDALTRDVLNLELLKIWSNTQKTIVFVTHSIDEAVFLSDRVVVMSARPGQIKEILPIDLERPRTKEIRNNPKFNEYARYLREVLG